MGSHLTGGFPDRNRNTTTVLLLALLPVLAVILFFVLPYSASLWRAFGERGETSVWENTALLRITVFTFKQALCSVPVSLALGLPGAWFLGTGRSAFTPILRTLTAIPFAMPSILVVLGFVLFFGNSGWVNTALLAFNKTTNGANEAPLQILYKPEAVILAHGFLNFPLVIRLVGDGLGRAKGAYAPVAASLGASPIKTIFTVILPLTVPAILSAALLVFLYCFTSFAIVLVLGGGPASTTLAVEIYRHARIFLNYHSAGVLALIETLIAISLFLTYVLLGKKSRSVRTDIHEWAMAGKESRLSRIFRYIYFTVMAFFILGPLLSIPVESLLYKPTRSAAQLLSFRWWTNLGDTCLPALSRSLLLAFLSATTACILAFLASGSVKILEETSGNSTAAHLIRFFAAAPIVSSGIVMGLGWLIFYGRSFARTPAALVMLHAVTALPFAFNFISEGFRSLPANTMKAAAVFGADPLRALLTTALPLSLPRIRSAWGFAAALSMGEANAVIMLGMEGWETLPLYIYRAIGAYRYGTACAAGTLLILGCAACFLLSEARKIHA